VYVDFAHTPQAVEAALAALNDHRTICVLGCGGDRDHFKRGPMGAVAVNGSDLLVVTDDNPRTEDPVAIREAILDGALDAKADGAGLAAAPHAARSSTAATAGLRSDAPWMEARQGDIVAVLGKGHEHGQEMRGSVTAFNDAAVVREEWARLREGAPTWS
jgi:UDP-N-acetylmuramoyl-L-alanyl-D-glutamate--2,6-diaminopimelate ligase